MTFTAYIERQKNIIRSRRYGAETLIFRGEETELSRTDRIFEKLGEIKGLNTAERMEYNKVRPGRS